MTPLDLDLERIANDYDDLTKRTEVIGAFRQKSDVGILRKVFDEDLNFADVTADTLTNYSKVPSDAKSSIKKLIIANEYDSLIHGFSSGLNGQKFSDFKREGNEFKPSNFLYAKRGCSHLGFMAMVTSTAYAAIEGLDFNAALDYLALGSALTASVVAGAFSWKSEDGVEGVNTFNKMIERAELIDTFKKDYDVNQKDLERF